MSTKKENQQNDNIVDNSSENTTEQKTSLISKLKNKVQKFNIINNTKDEKKSEMTKEEKEKLSNEQKEKKKEERLAKERELVTRKENKENLKNELDIVNSKILAKKETINDIKKQYTKEERKDRLAEQEVILKELTLEKVTLEKELNKEKKEIEKIEKFIKREDKIEDIFNDINELKKEVVNENETFFKVTDSDGQVKNIFVVSFGVLSAFIKKNIFRKKIENYENIQKTSKNIKVKITISFIFAIILTLCFLVSLKLVSSAKERYASFEQITTENSTSTDDLKKQKEQEEKEKILEEQRKADAIRIDDDALDEEITARLAGSFISYSFDINRKVTVTKKIHLFNTANWSDEAGVLEPGVELEVNKLVSPVGYMMYQISSGEHAGKFITANENFVKINSKEETIDTSLITRTDAVKFVVAQNVYSDAELTQVKSTLAANTILDLKGIGISKNNRLIYLLKDGSFIPVNPVKLTEVNRADEEAKKKAEEEAKKKKEEEEAKKKAEEENSSSTKNSTSNSSTNKNQTSNSSTTKRN